MSITTEDAGKILNALRLAGQLIHPDEDNSLLKKWRQEISEAIRLQEYIFASLQKGLAL